EMERIELDESIPELVPKSPMPRFKRVTLQELMESLNKAIVTENRRIKKEITNTNALREAGISLPKKKFNIQNKIRELYEKLIQHFTENRGKIKVSFTDFVGTNKEERVISFAPLLHLDHQKKVWLEQEKHFEDFYIWVKETYSKHNPDPFADLREEFGKEMEELKELDGEKGKTRRSDAMLKKKRLEKINKDFENPLGELSD
ncbi:MAG: segregation/condensation protein A, partial [Candidatus Pacearchaeota archaeon]|nr:segregation/condensation protein A [Candidatus Pacearchaeota archaeon]